MFECHPPANSPIFLEVTIWPVLCVPPPPPRFDANAHWESMLFPRRLAHIAPFWTFGHLGGVGGRAVPSQQLPVHDHHARGKSEDI